LDRHLTHPNYVFKSAQLNTVYLGANNVNKGYCMSTFEEHCHESIIKFGEAFPQVHTWLDEFMGKPGVFTRHRKFRHHLEGIEQCKVLFGKIAAEVAQQHIITDLKLEGWTDKDEFPKNEADYKRLGLW